MLYMQENNVFFNEFCDFLFQQDDPESKETEISEGTSQSDENGEKVSGARELTTPLAFYHCEARDVLKLG